MARYVAASAKYTLSAIKPNFAPVNEGGHLVERAIDKGVDCQFQHGGLMDWEWDIAARSLPMRGVGHDEEIRHRFSVYDTELQQRVHGWSNERRLQVEAALDAYCGQDIIKVEKPKLAPPWPAYDSIVAGGRGHSKDSVAQAIARKVKDDGYEPHYVANYERENLNRPEVLEAIARAEAEIVDRTSKEEEIIA